MDYLEKSACIHGEYRYRLTRRWGEGKLLNFLMLNPSTAYGIQDDPTIRRCVGFARDNGYSGIVVYNIYAFRSSKPSGCFAAPDPFGENDVYLAEVKGVVVCAWGCGAAKYTEDVKRALDAMSNRPRLLCLGTTKTNWPCHPLYRPKDTKLEEWKLPDQICPR